MNTKLKIFLIFCSCVAIFYFTMVSVVMVGVLTIIYFVVKFLISKYKHKLGKIFNREEK